MCLYALSQNVIAVVLAKTSIAIAIFLT